jgi:hypothetical protein
MSEPTDTAKIAADAIAKHMTICNFLLKKVKPPKNMVDRPATTQSVPKVIFLSNEEKEVIHLNSRKHQMDEKIKKIVPTKYDGLEYPIEYVSVPSKLQDMLAQKPWYMFFR